MSRLRRPLKSQLFLISAIFLTSFNTMAASNSSTSVQENISRLRKEAEEYAYNQALAKQALYNSKQDAVLRKQEAQQAEEDRLNRAKALEEMKSQQEQAIKEFKANAENSNDSQALQKLEDALESIKSEIATLSKKQVSIDNTLDNDGNPRDSPYCDTGAESSYLNSDGSDVDYYDVAIPYKLKASDVGGIAIDVESDIKKYRFDSSYKCSYGTYADTRLGCRVLTERSEITGSLAEKGYDTETGQPVYKAFGTEMYAITLPAGFMPDFVEDLGFYSFSKHTMAREGVLCDIYLTDGTIIHGAVCDGIGKGHSNTYGKCNGWTASSKSAAQDHTRYKLSQLKYSQYQYFVHSAVCHTVEFFGNGNKFMDYFGIEGDGSGNAIAFIRLYAASLSDSDVMVKDEYSSLVTRN